MKPLISIIIPTKNGAHTIEKCLTRLAQQTHKHFEVIIVDSGSTDNTVTLALQYHFVRVVQIDPAAFNHGLTRNFGVAEAAGDFVLMTVQDAWPADENWLTNMLSHFEDVAVMGVCGQQVVPHERDKNPHEWFRPFSVPKPRVVHFPEPEAWQALTSEELKAACGWDNVNAMYRKAALIKYPFAAVSFGEDMAWAKTVVLAGKKIVYDYNCRVYHYHHSTYDYTYNRTLTVLYFIHKNFGYLRKVEYSKADYLKIIYRNFRYKASFHWIPFNWSRMKAAAKAYQDAKLLLRQGGAAFDQYHWEKCGIPPQGKQNVIK